MFLPAAAHPQGPTLFTPDAVRELVDAMRDFNSSCANSCDAFAASVMTALFGATSRTTNSPQEDDVMGDAAAASAFATVNGNDSIELNVDDVVDATSDSEVETTAIDVDGVIGSVGEDANVLEDVLEDADGYDSDGNSTITIFGSDGEYVNDHMEDALDCESEYQAELTGDGGVIGSVTPVKAFASIFAREPERERLLRIVESTIGFADPLQELHFRTFFALEPDHERLQRTVERAHRTAELRASLLAIDREWEEAIRARRETNDDEFNSFQSHLDSKQNNNSEE